MNNEELARWISQYPINKLHDILIFHDINNAETLETLLSSSLLDDVCGFSHFIGGRHSDEMIKKYWIEIASNPKRLLINDFTLILQLIAFKDNKDNEIQNKYNDVLLIRSLSDIESIYQCQNVQNNDYLYLRSIFQGWEKMVNERNCKFKQQWNEYEIASFLLQQISRHIEFRKNRTNNTLSRMSINSNTLSPYEILLALNDFKPFITFLIDHKLNAKQLFHLDRKSELIGRLKDNNKCTSDIYIIWIKEKLLRLEYIDAAKKAREIFSKTKRKQRLNLQQIISQNIKCKQISFERITRMNEKEFIDLNIYNERCSKTILKEIKHKSFNINKMSNLTANLQIKWFTNYRKDKLYHILYSKKFDWTCFDTINKQILSLFFDTIRVLTKQESDDLFILLYKEYIRRRQSNVDDIGLPSIFNKKNKMMFYCDGSCHDGCDALDCIGTSFGQLLLYLQHSQLVLNGNPSYNEIRQIWYDAVYKNNPNLFNHPHIINENTFDLILLQIIKNDKISQIMLNTLYAFSTSTFIKDLKKHQLQTFITHDWNMKFMNTSSCCQIIINVLLDVIKNMENVFEAKYLFYSLLNAACQGHEQYVSEHNDNCCVIRNNISNKYFTLKEVENIDDYLSVFDYMHDTLSCASKYYLRLLLSAIIRVSTEFKKRTKSSSIMHNMKPKTIYLPTTNSDVDFNRKHHLITPTMRYTLPYHEFHENKSYILMRLQSSSYFGTHFIDLNHQDMMEMTNREFDGYLLCPFIVNQTAQTRLKRKDTAKGYDVRQYLCTDVNSVKLDTLCPFLCIQQYCNTYFVLFQMYYILWDKKYISLENIVSDIFIEGVQKQTQSELKSFLKKQCNLCESEIRRIMISTDRMNEYNDCLTHFIYIDWETLQAIGITSKSIETILNVIQRKRNHFFNAIESILWEEFPDIESIKKLFTDKNIGTFDDDVFYDEKHLEEFISNAESRYLLLHSKYVLKAYWKKAYFNFIATKQTLNNLYSNDHDLKQIFGILYDTFNGIKQNDLNIYDDVEDITQFNNIKKEEMNIAIMEHRHKQIVNNWFCDIIYSKTYWKQLNKHISQYFAHNRLGKDTVCNVGKIKEGMQQLCIPPDVIRDILEYLNGLKAAEIDIGIMVNHITQRQKQREEIVKQCNIIQEWTLIEQSLSKIIHFLQNVLSIRASHNEIVLIANKTKFYLDNTYDVNDGNQFISVQINAIQMTKAICFSRLMSMYIKMQKYNLQTILSMKNRDFTRSAYDTFGVHKGLTSNFHRNLKSFEKCIHSNTDIVDIIPSVVFQISMKDKEIRKAKTKGAGNFIASAKNINLESIYEMIKNVKQHEILSYDFGAEYVFEMMNLSKLRAKWDY